MFDEELKQIIQNIDHGKVMLEVSMFAGQPKSITRHEEYHSHKTRDNTEAGATILSFIKRIKDNGETGQKTFTINYRNGTVGMVIEQSGTTKQNI